MYHFLIVVWSLLLCTAAWSQKPQSPSPNELSSIAARGKLLQEYDQAAWHASDAVKVQAVPEGTVDRYVARKTDGGWVVMWGRFTPSHDKFLIVYEATQSARPEVFTVKKIEPPLEDVGFYLNAARAITTARQDFHGEERPYNVAVLPTDNESFYVYILPAQTAEGIYPVGGDIRYLISPDGLNIIRKKRMHQDVINFTIGETSTFSLHTHILSDTPEDSDVFDVLARRPLIPEYIFTCNFTYMVTPQASIQIVERSACGKDCEDYVARLSGFQAFRKAGCPDLSDQP